MKKYFIRLQGFECIKDDCFLAKNDQKARRLFLEFTKGKEIKYLTLCKITKYGVCLVPLKGTYDERIKKYPRKFKKKMQKQLKKTFEEVYDELFKEKHLALTLTDNEWEQLTPKVIENAILRAHVPTFLKKIAYKLLRRYK